MKTTDRGQLTEQACCDYLQQQGLRLVEQNYRTRGGEIDLIMREGDTWVFVEVRFRKNARYGSAVESVTAAKQQRILRTVEHYCQQHGITQAVRIDIVGMQYDHRQQYRFDWIQNALMAG